jgi:hypothetical protein
MERSVYIRTRPCCDNLGKSSARTRQTAQYSMKMAYTRGPIALALDRRISDIPLDGRLQSRTSNLVAWTKTMLSVIRDSISDARKQLRTGHQDIRTYFSDTAALERTMNVTLTTAIVATATTYRIDPRPTAIRQGLSRQEPSRSDFNRHSPIQTSRHPYLFLCHDSGRTNQERDASYHGRTDRQSVLSTGCAPFATNFSKQGPS